jgi:ankyrin repeat protein
MVVMHGQLRVVELLLEQGADPEKGKVITTTQHMLSTYVASIVGINGATALHVAASMVGIHSNHPFAHISYTSTS